MTFTLRVKTLLLVTALIVVVASVLSFIDTTRQRMTLTEQLERTTQVLSRNLAFNSEYGVLVQDREGLQDLVKTVLRETDVVYAGVFDQERHSLASGLRGEGGRVVEQALRQGPLTMPITYLGAGDARVCVVQHPVTLLGGRQRLTEGGLVPIPETTEEETIGSAVVAMSTASLQHHMDQVRRVITVVTCLIVAVAWAISFILVTLLTRPLAQLKTATQQVAAGQFEGRVDYTADDEIGSLARTFNQMVQDLKRQRAQLVDKEYVDNILRSMINTLIVVDQRGMVKTVNHAACELLGYHAEELIGQPLTRVFTGMDPFHGWANVELFYLSKEGTRIPVLFSSSVLRDNEGEVQGVVCVAQDITARKQAEESLRVRAEELVRSNAELEQFASVASHDLQEPLRMVASYVQLLAQRYRGQLDPNADEFIAYAVDGVERMRTLTRDLLEYARVGTQGKPFELTDCSAVVHQALANLQIAIDTVGAVVTCDPLPPVAADPSQLAQVFQNLLTNALKFHGTQPPRVHISATREDQSWVFAVQDHGIGIEPQYAERIFAIFQRLHTTAQYPGTGIGLAICKKVIERHGGRIWVESSLGRGATFFFTLPIVQASPGSHRNG